MAGRHTGGVAGARHMGVAVQRMHGPPAGRVPDEKDRSRCMHVVGRPAMIAGGRTASLK